MQQKLIALQIEILIDCYEDYSDDNFNGQYDLGENFIDCGLDELCLGDEGYISPDEGEGDNVCNRLVQYFPGNNFVIC